MWRSVDGSGQTRLRRVSRLLDAYLPLTGANVAAPHCQGPVIDVPASRFLRPYSAKLRALDALRLSRITGAMTAAAKRGAAFHLWWHPHNFGADTTENVEFLGRIISHYRRLKDSHGMVSQTMIEAATA
jgi:hypothetical protein